MAHNQDRLRELEQNRNRTPEEDTELAQLREEAGQQHPAGEQPAAPSNPDEQA